uniref:Uncharacterized protein n=1 Tax=Acrobeloides nanus TaxID=290746 RepID=A0A914CQC4_9BILA
MDAKHLTELMEAPNFVLNNSKAMKLSQKITGNPKHKQKRFSLGNSMEQAYELKASDQNEENKNQGQNQHTEKDHPNVFEQKSTNPPALADVQKYKCKQEEPHYMKSIPCIYEHEHEQRHHNYKEGSPVQPYNQNHTNEIKTFSRIPFGLEK